jgi:16S rRNA (cytosine967-C5)-methyltransferase
MHTGGTQSSLTVNANHFHRYLHYAASILTSYKGNESFHLFLKKYFALHKKHGSRDRKLISSLCYNYFRLGCGVSQQKDLREKLLLSSFLCETNLSLLPDFFKPERNASIQLSLYEKLKAVEKEFNPEKIFPLPGELSDEINFQQFNLSFLIRPKLFIRIRTGFKDIVVNKIKSAGLSFEELSESCLAFANNEKASSIIDIDKEAVVQDYNSQKTLDVVKQAMQSDESEISIWDCCAGSGGKSVLSFDIFKNINLTVSDKRKNILDNLRLRFNKAGITNYKLVLADLQLPASASGLISSTFDLIIADVPCTGSGTWSRTPEQLTFSHKKDIDKYAALQKKIIENTVSHLGNKGYFLYITCSVFKKENEENVAFIQKKFQLNLLRMEYLKGYEIQADSLFVALFKTPVLH